MAKKKKKAPTPRRPPKKTAKKKAAKTGAPGARPKKAPKKKTAKKKTSPGRWPPKTTALDLDPPPRKAAKKKAKPKAKKPAKKKTKKKTPKRRAPAAPPATPPKRKARAAPPTPASLARKYPAALDMAILLLISGAPSYMAAATLVKKNKLDRPTARRLAAMAADKIAIAADFDRRHEIGTAARRLDHLYTTAIGMADTKAAIAAVRERNHLFDLYPNQTQGDDTADQSATVADQARQLDLIAAHLLPLALAAPDYPLTEHARIAAERIRRCK